MRALRSSQLTLTALFLACLCAGAAAQEATPGIFETHGDVGTTPKTGSVEYDSTAREYRVTGGGANIWSTVDAFQFAWKRLSGDITITADVRFVGTGAIDHRKAVLMIRQDLAPDSAYADAALHGDGLTSLQFRAGQGVATSEVRSDLKAPLRIRIERHGDQFTMYAGQPGEELKASAPVKVVLRDPVYAGIGVCSHDANILETAIFSNVKVERHDRIRSKISIYDLKDRSIQVIYSADELFEAPNWSPDGKYLLVNSNGKLFRLALNATGPVSPERLDADPGYRCNNDHGLSPDGKLLAFSASSPSSKDSQVFLAAPDGSNPRLITPAAPSYFHGWSPDGRWLALVGERDGKFGIDRIPVTGGNEQRLTVHAHYDDGPDYSPDGKWIYFNSDRSGSWDIWRMPAAGAGANDRRAEQVTRDEFEDWFPHVSPDGKWLVFLSFPKGTSGHDDRLDVQLRMMPLRGRKLKPGPIQPAAKIFGGQGTINVNSWSPDSKQFAFVSYEVNSSASH